MPLQTVGHENFVEPGASIWRYMGLEKLLSMLESDSLVLTQLLLMEDKYEGAWTRAHFEVEVEFGKAGGYDGAKWTEEHQEIIQRKTYVSCWYLSEYESAAMWSHYGQNGIAIRSTYAQLSNEFENHDGAVRIGRVQYVDYNDATIKTPSYMLPYFKRLSYEHEKEVRVAVEASVEVEENDDVEVYRQKRKDAYRALPDTMSVAVKPQNLISSIYVAPGSAKWFREVVKNVIEKRYELECDVITSDVDARPNYR